MCYMPSLLFLPFSVTMVILLVTVTEGKHYYSDRFPDLNPADLPTLTSEDFIQHLQHLSAGNYNCGNHNKLARHFIRNQTVTCNDGSPAGYYLRKSSARNSKWLVFLEGGWFCFDQDSCNSRWATQNILMGSYNWKPHRFGTGILSADRQENPFMYNYNTVMIPYCSSDAWSGTRHTRTKNDFAFLGALILEEVIKDLLYAHGLADAASMILAGSSAGATGVLVNLDRITGILAQLAPRVEVRGIVDSGWFLDNQQYKASNCRDILSCSPTDSITKGFKHWQGLVPESCKKHYSESEHWRCYFGYRIYPTLKTPVFVVQHLFDEAQIIADNVGTPVHREQWQYIIHIGSDMRRTLQNVSAVFAPACLSHILLTSGDWQRVSLRGVTLPNAIHCWEGGLKEKNLYSRHTHTKSYVDLAVKLITGEYPQSSSTGLQADAPPELPRKNKRHKRKRSKVRGPKKQAQILRAREEKRKQKQQLRAKKKRKKQARRRKARDRKRLNRKTTPGLRKQVQQHKTTPTLRKQTHIQQQQHSMHSFYIDSKQHSSAATRGAPITDMSHKPVTTSKQDAKRTPKASKLDAKRTPKASKTDTKRTTKASKTDSKRTTKTSQKQEERRHGRGRRSLVFDEHDIHHMQYHDNHCNHHLFDSCDWPQCNEYCPKFYNRMSGEEMDFMEMLMQFGLDMTNMAQALNIDLSSMGNMDQSQLFRLLGNL